MHIYEPGKSILNMYVSRERKGSAVKLIVDQDLCISCGLCIETCPEVFDWNDDGKADVILDPVPEELEESAREAQDGCPTEAIQEP